jgi:hypothetical protein
LKVVIEGGEKSCRNFSPSEIEDVFARTTTTSGPINKRMAQAYSAHQIGIKTILHAILIVGW